MATESISRNKTSRLFLAAVGVGSFLIFLIQPIAARALLPSFGGSGSVWITALVFYQVALATGTLLAHGARSRLSVRGQTVVLAVLACGALLALSRAPQPIEFFSDLPALRLLLSLAISVGLPFLLLAVAGPLVQSWAAERSGEEPSGRGIYALYAISNAASLIALAAYPTLFESRWSIAQQYWIWRGLFAVEVLLILVLARRAGRRSPAAKRWDPGAPPARRAILAWLAWSAAGVMVLTSTSALIGQEIAAIPLLWIVPLLLYLLTWVVTFCGAVHPNGELRAAMILAALLLILPAVDSGMHLGLPLRLGGALVAMSLACLAIHAALYRLSPSQRHLTRFYAAIAVGGALGGILSGVVAVQVFDDWRDLGLAYGLAALLAAIRLIRRPHAPGRLRGAALISAACLMAAVSVRLLVVTGMERPGLLLKHRDFHGLVRVVEEGTEDPLRHRLVLYHGSTVHGTQLMAPRLRGVPTTYFGRSTGAGIAVRTEQILRGEERGLKIGAVGLGVGTLAAYLRVQDSMRFYEISPAVAAIALNHGPLGDPGTHFTYLDDAPGEVDIVVGDARLSLTAELEARPEGNGYDLLALDAFAGDSVPMHLLTREAFALYTDHLAPGGMIAVHVSSNWLDLVPLAYAWAEAERWEALTISSRGSADGVLGKNAVWVLLFRGRQTLQILADECGPLIASGRIMVQNRRNVDYGNLRPWTDDRGDLLTLMRSRIRLREPRNPPTRSAAP